MSVIQRLDGKPIEQIVETMLGICEGQIHFLEKDHAKGFDMVNLLKFLREMRNQKEGWEIVKKTLASSGKEAESGSPVASLSGPTHETDGMEKTEFQQILSGLEEIKQELKRPRHFDVDCNI